MSPLCGPSDFTSQTSLRVRRPHMRKDPANRSVKVPSLRGRCQQRLIYRPGNSEVVVDRATAKLQLQNPTHIVVSKCCQCGRFHRNNVHESPPGEAAL